MPRKGPLPERELKICARLYEARERVGYPREFVAMTLRIEVGALKRVELGRVPLRYDFALTLLPLLGCNPFWLATGTGSFEPSVRLPSASQLGIESKNALFSEVFDSFLNKHLRAIDPYKPLTRRETQNLAVDMAARSSKLHILTGSFNSWLNNLPDAELTRFTDAVLAHAKSLFEQLPHDEWAVVLERRQREALSNAIIDLAEGKRGLTNVIVSDNKSDVKAQWPLLKARLQKATSEKGSKSRLAEFLGLPLSSVSLWLSDSKSAREPGAETALRMLYWVERREHK